jgi:hypothetical protein
MSDAPTDKRTDYLTAKQLADVLQVSETTVHRLRRTGRIPAVYVTDRLARYSLKDVRRALARGGDRAGATEPAAPEADDLQMGFADVFESFETDGQ